MILVEQEENQRFPAIPYFYEHTRWLKKINLTNERSAQTTLIYTAPYEATRFAPPYSAIFRSHGPLFSTGNRGCVAVPTRSPLRSSDNKRSVIRVRWKTLTRLSCSNARPQWLMFVTPFSRGWTARGYVAMTHYRGAGFSNSAEAPLASFVQQYASFASRSIYDQILLWNRRSSWSRRPLYAPIS